MITAYKIRYNITPAVFVEVRVVAANQVEAYEKGQSIIGTYLDLLQHDDYLTVDITETEYYHA